LLQSQYLVGWDEWLQRVDCVEKGRFMEQGGNPCNEQEKKSVRQIYPQNMWITLSLIRRNLS